MNSVDLKRLPDIVLEEDEPVFNEPWEAQAFAMVVNLHERGAFEWDEWAQCLSEQIHGEDERSYYEHWLCALEVIVAKKNLASSFALTEKKKAWQDAAARTLHGQPIVL